MVDVPAKLAARVRLFDTGHNRKSDAHDAHAVAVVAVRTQGLRVLAHDAQLEALRMLADRREELTRQRVQTVARLQRLLSELTPGKAKKDITALQAKAILATVRPRDLVGKTRRRAARRAGLGGQEDQAAHRGAEGDGASPRAAPLDASSGEQIRHRLSRAGNRRMNHMLHIAAATQIRLDTEGRAYYRRKLGAGKTRKEAMRCLKRRISDAVYRQLIADADRAHRDTSADRAERAREGTAGRLKNPARSTCPRTSTLRISHFPDPHARRYAGLPEAERPQRNQSSKRPVDNRREPE